MSEEKGKLISFLKFKQKQKERQEEKPRLLVDHSTGKITGEPSFNEDDFGDRMQRIRASLEKINQLMKELRETTRK